MEPLGAGEGVNLRPSARAGTDYGTVTAAE